ncbi:MAG: type I methionyl aminopeptidase [Ruminococcaceae bacterium]|nr:type I methionyl aminopeptidase [Oscillospiraceae bacterium]
MIRLKNSEQIELMKIAGRITGEALLVAEEAVREGISTWELDRIIRAYIEKCGAKPTFLGYGGFPGSACISVNEEVIHGIPSKKKILREGDIVKVDVGACYRGYNGDSARTFPVGKISDEATRLIEVTKQSFFEAVKHALVGNRIGDIGSAVQDCAEAAGYSVVRKYVGHGVGAELHEDPEVPNFGTKGRGVRIYSGMTLAIEPMVNQGTADVNVLDNGWTVVTADGKLSAHYEHSIAVTDNGPLLLTDVK